MPMPIIIAYSEKGDFENLDLTLMMPKPITIVGLLTAKKAILTVPLQTTTKR